MPIHHTPSPEARRIEQQLGMLVAFALGVVVGAFCAVLYFQ